MISVISVQTYVTADVMSSQLLSNGTKLIENFKSLYGFGGRCLNMFVWILNHVSQMTTFNVIFQRDLFNQFNINFLINDIDWLKFEIRPS